MALWWRSLTPLAFIACEGYLCFSPMSQLRCVCVCAVFLETWTVSEVFKEPHGSLEAALQKDVYINTISPVHPMLHRHSHLHLIHLSFCFYPPMTEWFRLILKWNGSTTSNREWMLMTLFIVAKHWTVLRRSFLFPSLEAFAFRGLLRRPSPSLKPSMSLWCVCEPRVFFEGVRFHIFPETPRIWQEAEPPPNCCFNPHIKVR